MIVETAQYLYWMVIADAASRVELGMTEEPTLPQGCLEYIKPKHQRSHKSTGARSWVIRSEAPKYWWSRFGSPFTRSMLDSMVRSTPGWSSVTIEVTKGVTSIAQRIIDYCTDEYAESMRLWIMNMDHQDYGLIVRMCV